MGQDLKPSTSVNTKCKHQVSTQAHLALSTPVGLNVVDPASNDRLAPPPHPTRSLHASLSGLVSLPICEVCTAVYRETPKGSVNSCYRRDEGKPGQRTPSLQSSKRQDRVPRWTPEINTYMNVYIHKYIQYIYIIYIYINTHITYTQYSRAKQYRSFAHFLESHM